MPLTDPKWDEATYQIQDRTAEALQASLGEGAGSWAAARDRALRLALTSPALAGQPRALAEDIATNVANDLYLLGPLEDLLAAPEVDEVMVNSPTDVRVEVRGKIGRTSYRFRDDSHVMRIIQRICDADNRRCDNTNPMCDCTLRRPGAAFDGSRVNVVAKPVAADHPLIDIRKFSDDMLGVDDLVRLGTLDGRMASFLSALVRARMNIVIMGGTGSGKTTLLNVMSDFIPDDQRIITVEDTTELSLHKSHVIRMEARQPNIEGVGEVTIRQIIINNLRQRPDRIIVGECRGAEAFDMLQAMGTGHDGSLTTIHANDARGAISRLQMMVQMSEAGAQLPQSAIMQVICSAVDFVVCVNRLPDGSRKVTEVCEVQGMQDDGHGRAVATMAPIMRFDIEGYAPDGRVLGSFSPTGEHMSAAHLARFSVNGVQVERDWFRGWPA